MNIRATIVLTVLAVAGVIAAVWTERAGPSTGVAASAATSRPLLADRSWSLDDVNRIALERGGDRWEFVRRDEGWWQTQPVPHAMVAGHMRSLVQLAADLSVTGEIDPTGTGDTLNEETLGLAPPAGTLTIAWPGGTERLRLGRRGIAGRSYLQRGDASTVFVVNHDLHARCLEDDPVAWRDGSLFPDASVESDRIEIVSGPQSVVLFRDRRTWRMESPARTRVNGAALEALVQALARSRSEAFILDRPDDLAPFGLTTPAGSVVVTTTRVTQGATGDVQRTKVTRRLLLGARIGVASQDRFGMIDDPDIGPVVVRIGQGLLEAMFLRPEQLVSATASGVVTADIKAIRISGPDDEFRIERELPQWIAVDHGRAVVDDERVGTLLEVLTNVRAVEVELNRFPRELSVGTITLFGFDGRPIDTVRIAKDPVTGRWILENGDDVLRFLPANTQVGLTAGAFGL